MRTTISGATAAVLLQVRNNSVLTKMRSGIPLYEIAGGMGISTAEASDIMEAELKNEKKKKELADRKQIIEFHTGGMDNVKISETVNVPVNFVLQTIAVHYSRQLNVEKAVTHFHTPEKEVNPDTLTTLNVAERTKRNDDVVKAYESGLKVAQVAEMYGLAIPMVYFILRKRGLKLQRSKSRIAEGKLKQIEEELKSGKTVKEIAKLFDLHPQTVYLILRKKKCCGTTYSADERFLKVKQMHNEGKNLKEIGEAVDMHYRSVWNLLRLKGVVGLRREAFQKMSRQMAALYRKGISRDELCKRFDKDILYVSGVLRKKGFVFQDSERLEKIKNAYLNGKTITEVAAEFGITDQRVRAVLKKKEVSFLGVEEQRRFDIAVLFNRNVSIADIAEQMKLMPCSVITNLIGQGLLTTKGIFRKKRQWVLEEYKKGLTDVTQLSNRYNMRPAEIERIVNGTMRAPLEQIRERDERIAKLHGEGVPTYEIAERLNIKKTIVWKVFGKSGLHSNDTTFLFAKKCERIIPLLKEGKPYKEIEKEQRVSLKTIRKVRNSMYKNDDPENENV